MKALFFAFIFSAISVHADEPAHEYTLKISYEVVCPNLDEKAFPGITGAVSYAGRTLRLDLLKYTHESELALPSQKEPRLSDLTFRWNASSTCELRSIKPRIEKEPVPSDTFAALAIKHSPYLVVRKDQLQARNRDLPLAVTYSVMPTSKGTNKLRYTIFFSNETVKGLGATTKAASLDHYGRRTDIEWMYDVEFDAGLNVVSRKYQSGIIAGFGHATRKFSGRYLPGTEHPILFNNAKHNVFTHRGELNDEGCSAREAYHFVPREELKDAEAREWWQWRKPWVFDLSDRELRRGDGAGEFAAPASDYLYVLLTGKMKKSRLRLNFAHETFFIRSGKVSKLGEGLWGKQSFTAVKMTEAEQIKGGFLSMLRLKRGLIFRHLGTLNLEPMKFYRLKPDPEQGYALVDVSDQFRCNEQFECNYGPQPLPESEGVQ